MDALKGHQTNSKINSDTLFWGPQSLFVPTTTTTRATTTTNNNKQQTTNTTNNYKNLRMNIQLTDCVWQGAFLSLDIHELSAGEFAVKMRIS